jgi:hypothetical protein
MDLHSAHAHTHPLTHSLRVDHLLDEGRDVEGVDSPVLLPVEDQLRFPAVDQQLDFKLS